MVGIRILLRIALPTLVWGLFVTSDAAQAGRLRLATTTSTENSGLLNVLLPAFERQCGCTVDVIAVGTGKAMKLGEAGDVDVVLVHARPLEDRFIATGFGIGRRDVMYNDFVLIGPSGDPAGVKAAKTAAEVLRRIAKSRVSFISRGDESGTHQKERELWQQAGIHPAGPWYIETGQGMGEVITMATQKQAYTLTDRGTYLAFRSRKTDLAILFQGEPVLFNPYGVMAVNPARHPHVQYRLAQRFIEFLTSPEGQKLIAGFRIEGEQLFFPLAGRH